MHKTSKIVIIAETTAQISYAQKLIDYCKSYDVQASVDTRQIAFHAKLSDVFNHIDDADYVFIVGARQETETSVLIRNRKHDRSESFRIDGALQLFKEGRL